MLVGLPLSISWGSPLTQILVFERIALRFCFSWGLGNFAPVVVEWGGFPS